MHVDLKHYLETQIISLYRHFDSAHQINHVMTVIENALEIAKDYDVNLDMMFVVACYHDIGMQFGRSDHHITGGQFLFDDQYLRRWFSIDELSIMKEAIEDHRASNDAPPRTIYGSIIAEADRDIDPDVVILRTVQFGLTHYPNLNQDEHISRAYAHIQDKYGPNGYLKLWLKTKKNQDGLQKIHQLLEEKDKLVSIIIKHYNSFKQI